MSKTKKYSIEKLRFENTLISIRYSIYDEIYIIVDTTNYKRKLIKFNKEYRRIYEIIIDKESNDIIVDDEKIIIQCNMKLLYIYNNNIKNVNEKYIENILPSEFENKNFIILISMCINYNNNIIIYCYNLLNDESYVIELNNNLEYIKSYLINIKNIYNTSININSHNDIFIEIDKSIYVLDNNFLYFEKYFELNDEYNWIIDKYDNIILQKDEKIYKVDNYNIIQIDKLDVLDQNIYKIYLVVNDRILFLNNNILGNTFDWVIYLNN